MNKALTPNESAELLASKMRQQNRRIETASERLKQQAVEQFGASENTIRDRVQQIVRVSKNGKA